MNKQQYRIRNWSEYNRALIQRGSIDVWFSEETLSRWRYQGNHKPGGLKKYSDIAIETCLIIKSVFQLTYRSCQGFLLSLKRLLNLANLPLPHYSTLCRRSKYLEVDMNVSKKQSINNVLVDATGVHVYGENQWKRLKHGLQKHKVWRKLHLAIDGSDQQILSLELSNSVKHELSFFSPLIDSISEPIENIIGDGGYAKRPCYKKAYERGIKLITPPQYNARLKSEDKSYDQSDAMNERDNTITKVRALGLTQWKIESGYHLRSLVETAMHRLKRIFGESINNKTLDSQKVELCLRCKALNIMTQLGMPKAVPI